MGMIVWEEQARKMAEWVFRDAWNSHVHRRGAAALLRWLDRTDFFTAPAGAKHHGAYRGGLLRHSLDVYWELRESWPIKSAEDEETVAICGLLHDVCKAGVYHLERDGTYACRDPLPLGHGEKSVYLISQFIRLTDEEALAIRWHMGAYDEAVKGGSRALDAAQDLSPLVFALHAADMRATLAEKREERGT